MDDHSPRFLLNYAPPESASTCHWRATILFVFSISSMGANSFAIWRAFLRLYQVRDVYARLISNPRAFGRDIDPTVIESLKDTSTLSWSTAFFIITLGIGILLSIQLIWIAFTLHRDQAVALKRLKQYFFCKPVATVLTLVGLNIWDAQFRHYWIAATRHMSLGDGPPIIFTTLVLIGAWIPIWWLRKVFFPDYTLLPPFKRN